MVQDETKILSSVSQAGSDFDRGEHSPTVKNTYKLQDALNNKPDIQDL